MINRKELVRRHNPKLNAIVTESPIAVGNGEFAFSADITGMQSLYGEYLQANAPLCTMSRWGWHTKPAKNERGRYTLNDIEMTRYEYEGRVSEYAVERKPGSEEAYDWLRHNPHRLNLAKISLTANDSAISRDDLSDIKQELDLYSGTLNSSFNVRGNPAEILTVCAKNSDVVGFSVKSDALGLLKVEISFPYGSHSISASDWENEDCHKTAVIENSNGNVLIERTLDSDKYFIYISYERAEFNRSGKHSLILSANGNELKFTVAFFQAKKGRYFCFNEVCLDSVKGWENFWLTGGIVDFSRSKDSRAAELERRTILSQYLTAIHSSGSFPPQETGLACNSWYGKFHLEMHILHSGWLPLWGRSELLEKSFDWYLHILDKARDNAQRNGYKGARWPKMTGPVGIDSPSMIATLLIWQQPHIIYMLELARNTRTEDAQSDFIHKYWVIVRETADFMASFVKRNNETGLFDLPSPLIPAQEEHSPENVVNPAFELSYWRFGLSKAILWAKELGCDFKIWENIRDNLASPTALGGVYLAHKNCPDTFESFNRDHPSMLYSLGFIPCETVDCQIMSDTFDLVRKCWDFKTLWGWDFALMAMTLTRINRPDDAIDILMIDTAKNSYVGSGNNYQRGRTDLPLYLPGNGALLFALPLMLAGYGENRDTPGFPKNGMWDIEFEGILPLPY